MNFDDIARRLGSRWRRDGNKLVLDGAARIVVEQRRGNVWLWIIEPADKRCFELELGDGDAALEYLAKHSHELSLATYLTHYLALSSLCPTSIIAWEQFEGA